LAHVARLGFNFDADTAKAACADETFFKEAAGAISDD
jgi:hypothetical protein